MLSKIVKCVVTSIVLGAIGVALHLWHLRTSPVQEGVLATVNGQAITIQRVQLYVDVNQPLGAGSSFDDMRRAHAQALASLIVFRLMEQELAANGLLPDAATMDTANRVLLADYDSETLREIFEEGAFNEAEWLVFMRDTHIAALFEKHVLQKSVRADLANVRDYYAANKSQFALPDTYRMCSIRAGSRAEVEEFCTTLGDGKKAAPGHLAPLHPSCVTVKQDELPDALQPLAKRAKTNTCSKAENLGDFWQAAWLVSVGKGRALPVPEAYVVIENLLRHNEKYTAFAAWLEKALSRADIRLAPEIAPELLNLQNGEKRLLLPVTETSGIKQGKQ